MSPFVRPAVLRWSPENAVICRSIADINGAVMIVQISDLACIFRCALSGGRHNRKNIGYTERGCIGVAAQSVCHVPAQREVLSTLQRRVRGLRNIVVVRRVNVVKNVQRSSAGRVSTDWSAMLTEPVDTLVIIEYRFPVALVM